ALGDRPDVIIGCEVTASFPGTQIDAHLGVLDITERQHAEIQRRRHDIAGLLPYLKEEGIFTILNHVASQVSGRLTAAHIAGLLPWVDAFEVINGSRLYEQNHTAAALAQSAAKACVGGSDSHTGRGVGRTYTVVDDARTREEFMQGLREGRARAEGCHGSYFTMASDVIRFAGRFYEDRTWRLVARAWEWDRHAFVFGGLLGLPLLCVPLVGAMVHFIEEARFNRSLLVDLVARPAIARIPAVEMTEAAWS